MAEGIGRIISQRCHSVDIITDDGQTMDGS